MEKDPRELRRSEFVSPSQTHFFKMGITGFKMASNMFMRMEFPVKRDRVLSSSLRTLIYVKKQLQKHWCEAVHCNAEQTRYFFQQIKNGFGGLQLLPVDLALLTLGVLAS